MFGYHLMSVIWTKQSRQKVNYYKRWRTDAVFAFTICYKISPLVQGLYILVTFWRLPLFYITKHPSTYLQADSVIDIFTSWLSNALPTHPDDFQCVLFWLILNRTKNLSFFVCKMWSVYARGHRAGSTIHSSMIVSRNLRHRNKSHLAIVLNHT